MGNLYLRNYYDFFSIRIRDTNRHTTLLVFTRVRYTHFLNGYLFIYIFFFCFIISRTNVKIYFDKHIIFSRDFSRRLARGGARFLTVQFERVR